MNTRQRRGAGFTIVELLVVIVVVGILASITIVAFNGIQNRANDAAVKSDLANAAKKLTLWKIENGGSYPTPSQLDLVDLYATKGSYMTGRGNFYYCASSDYQSYAIGAVTKNDANMMLHDGVIENRSGNTVWLSSTCSEVGVTVNPPTGFGTSGHSTTWNSWVKG